MGKASYFQSDFRGGEWSPFAQGRMDDPAYKTGMNVCRNGIPTEEGAWVKRSGLAWCETSRGGRPARLLQFAFAQEDPYIMEFTDQHLRFFSAGTLVMEDVEFVVTDVSTATPAVITTSAAHGFTDADQVRFLKPEGDLLAGIGPLMNRTFLLGSPGGTTFAIGDPNDATPFDGTWVDLEGVTIAVSKVLDIETPWVNPDIQLLRRVQGEGHVLLLCPGYKPYDLVERIVEGVDDHDFKAFDLDPAELIDGPYLDPVEAATITPSGTSGSITLTEGGAAVEFKVTDIGRQIRLRSSPAAYDAATAYAVGDSVTFQGDPYTALAASTGKQPDLSFDDWGIDPAAALWTWGEITGFTNANVVTFLIKGDPLLGTSAITEWRMGLYSDTTGWPTCGTYHEGRLWLGGVVDNRFDASMSNKALTFSPTAADGTVADNNAIAETLNAPSVNQIEWMNNDDQGVLMGSQAGVWLIRASQANDPLTSTSIQAKQMTNWGSANVECARAGMSILFVNRHERKLFEYTAFGEARFGASNLSVNSKHLTTTDGIAEIAYQQELVPCVWARTNGNELAGCTYKRDNPLGTQAAAFAGWHRHDHGGGRVFTGLEAGASPYGVLDAIYVVALDEETRIHFVEVMVPIFDEGFDDYNAFFVDDGTYPVVAEIVGTGPGATIQLWGMYHLRNTTVSVSAAGMDLGDYEVDERGSVTVPVNDPDVADGGFTEAFLTTVTTSGRGNLLGRGVFIHKGIREPGTVDGSGVLEYLNPGGETDGHDHRVDWQRGVMANRRATPSPCYNLFNVDSGAELVTRVADADFGADIPFIFGPLTGSVYTHGAISTDRSIIRLSGTDLTTITEISDGDFTLPATMFSFASPTIEYVAEFSIVAGDWRNTNNGLMLASFTDDGATVVGTAGTFATSRYGITTVFSGGQPAAGPGVTIGNMDYASMYVLMNRIGGLAAGVPVRTALYRISITNGTDIASTLVGNIDPQHIEATWTHFAETAFGTLDETDGHYIGMARTGPAAAYNGATGYTIGDIALASGHVYWSKTDTNTGNNPVSDAGVHWQDLGVYAPTHLSYLFKVHSGTGAILWVTPMDAYGFSTFLPQSVTFYTTRCKAGRWATYTNNGLATDHPYIVVDTATGSDAMTITVKGVSQGENQCSFDDVRGIAIFAGSYTRAVGTPLPVGSTPDSFSNWLAITGIEGTIDEDPYIIPIAVGYTYTSQGQILRPNAQEQTGALNGPGFGKTRRSHQFACLMNRTQKISFGTDFTKLRPAEFRTAGGTPIPNYTLYSGFVQTTLEDDYSLDSMLAWECARPVPAAVLTIGAYLQTQDK